MLDVMFLVKRFIIFHIFGITNAEGIHWILYSKNAALGHFIKHKSLFSEEYHISFLLAAADPWFEDFH